MRSKLILTAAASLFIGAASARAQSEILLEGFEDGIENITLIGSRGGSGNTVLTHVSRADTDIGVTQGDKALKVEIYNDHKWWSEDFQITLSAEAAAVLKEAWDGDPVTGEKPLARYLLNYDLTFPAAGEVFWMNQAVHNNWEPIREFNTPGNDMEPFTVSIPLDLINSALLLNEDGTANLRFVNNADWADGNIPTFYIDNIRLVDQWRGNTPPTVTVIESFEEGIDVATVTAEGGRTTIESYSRTAEDDPHVTHGATSLKVTQGQPEGWANDWTLDLSGS